jgi:hypothetical protein
MADYTLDEIDKALKNFEGVWSERRLDYQKNAKFVRKIDGLLSKSSAIKRTVARIRKEDIELDKVFFRLEKQRRWSKVSR